MLTRFEATELIKSLPTGHTEQLKTNIRNNNKKGQRDKIYSQRCSEIVRPQRVKVVVISHDVFFVEFWRAFSRVLLNQLKSFLVNSNVLISQRLSLFNEKSYDLWNCPCKSHYQSSS